jgi:hypothetical protein
LDWVVARTFYGTRLALACARATTCGGWVVLLFTFGLSYLCFTRALAQGSSAALLNGCIFGLWLTDGVLTPTWPR